MCTILSEEIYEAVLAAAFRGDLTADWRTCDEIQYGNLWSVPIDWKSNHIVDVAEVAIYASIKTKSL